MSGRIHPRLALLGKRIREVRESRAVSQENFALEAGLARSYYSGIERGRRNVAALNLIRIAIALDCEVGDLFPKVKELRRRAKDR
jgi:transcriptional regulator with XRE-family HTH domain